jgi:ABC-type lipoprotein release transport system permease subunit
MMKMKFLLALSWKNLFRYGRRTIITATAIAVGLGIYIWMDAWLIGLNQASRRNLVYYETGAAQLMSERYWEERKYLPLKYVIEQPQEVEALLDGLGVAHTRRVVFAGEVFTQEGSLQVRLEGLDPRTDGRVYELEEAVEQGRYLRPGESGALLGAWLAEDLRMGVGDLLTVRTRTRYGSFQVFDLEVVGIFLTPNPQVNRGVAYLPLDTADELLEMEGAVTHLPVIFPDWLRPEAQTAALNAALGARRPGVQAMSWKDLARDYLNVSQGDIVSTYVMLFLVFIIAAVGISNTMLMAVMERAREIGMMRAQGMPDRAVRLSFILEAGGIGLIGAAGGLVLGAVLSFWIVNWGVDFGGMMQEMDMGYRVSGAMRGAWNPMAFLNAALFGVFSTMLFAILPTWRAVRMKITEALGHA